MPRSGSPRVSRTRDKSRKTRAPIAAKRRPRAAPLTMSRPIVRRMPACVGCGGPAARYRSVTDRYRRVTFRDDSSARRQGSTPLPRRAAPSPGRGIGLAMPSSSRCARRRDTLRFRPGCRLSQPARFTCAAADEPSKVPISCIHTIDRISRTLYNTMRGRSDHDAGAEGGAEAGHSRTTQSEHFRNSPPTRGLGVRSRTRIQLHGPSNRQEVGARNCARLSQSRRRLALTVGDTGFRGCRRVTKIKR